MNFDRTTIKWKLLVYFFLMFSAFTLSMIFFQDRREKHFRTALLKNSLSECIDLTNRYITSNAITKDKFHDLDSLKDLIPPGKVQITIIDLDGKVLYDNSMDDFSHLGNYKDRPEIKKALNHKSGDRISYTNTGKEEFYYYAKTFNDFIITAAIPYDNEIRDFIRSEEFHLPFYFLLFIIFGLLLNFISTNINGNILNLKEFLVKIKQGESYDQKLQFSNDEIGLISKEIKDLYEQYDRKQSNLLLEKEKLISHLYAKKEGVAFFDRHKKEIFSNYHFICYLNNITGKNILSVEELFHNEEFSQVNEYIQDILEDQHSCEQSNPPGQQFKIPGNNSEYHLQVIFSQDRSFEMILTSKG